MNMGGDFSTAGRPGNQPSHQPLSSTPPSFVAL